MTVDQDSFRSAMGRFASGVTIVTAVDGRGRDHGITVSAFASLSLSPPLLLVCVDRSSSVHAVLETAPRFVVNILASEQEALARRFSAIDGDRFDGIGYVRGQCGGAILEDVLAAIECRKCNELEGGDHTIFVGEVEATHVRTGSPLLYYRGGYAELEH